MSTRHEVSYLIHYGSLFQTATGIVTNCNSYFIIKCDRSLLQKASGFLFQNVIVLLQNATGITKCDDFIKKLDSHYKMRRLLQIATVQSLMAEKFGNTSQFFSADVTKGILKMVSEAH